MLAIPPTESIRKKKKREGAAESERERKRTEARREQGREDRREGRAGERDEEPYSANAPPCRKGARGEVAAGGTAASGRESRFQAAPRLSSAWGERDEDKLRSERRRERGAGRGRGWCTGARAKEREARRGGAVLGSPRRARERGGRLVRKVSLKLLQSLSPRSLARAARARC